MSRELTSHDLHVACALCTARYYAEGAKWFGPHFADPAACCAQCNADAMKLLLVDAPPSERVPEKIAGMAVVLDPTVPLGVAQIRDANGKLCAELDLLYGGYTLYRRPDA